MTSAVTPEQEVLLDIEVRALGQLIELDLVERTERLRAAGVPVVHIAAQLSTVLLALAGTTITASFVALSVGDAGRGRIPTLALEGLTKLLCTEAALGARAISNKVVQRVRAEARVS